jgi:hypothetical protein
MRGLVCRTAEDGPLTMGYGHRSYALASLTEPSSQPLVRFPCPVLRTKGPVAYAGLSSSTSGEAGTARGDNPGHRTPSKVLASEALRVRL